LLGCGIQGRKHKKFTGREEEQSGGGDKFLRTGLPDVCYACLAQQVLSALSSAHATTQDTNVTWPTVAHTHLDSLAVPAWVLHT
jgi:hypothetical protein